MSIICAFDWNALSAIANICIALLALFTYLYTRSQTKRQDELRHEDIRARLSFSVVEWNNLYMLKITNIGREAAYKIQLNVSGSPITENPIDLVKDVFARLRATTINIEAEQSVYYLVSPTESAQGEQGLEGGKQYDMKSIHEWLSTHDNESIYITGQYNNRYKIEEEFSIRDYLQFGAFEHKEPIEEIAEAIYSRDPKDKAIQKNIQFIKESLKNKYNG